MQTRSTFGSTARITSLALVLLGLAVAAEAGPPLICHRFDAGSAKLLPWGDDTKGWNTPHPSYDVSRLTEDTLQLLSPDAPILARMENLRRATIYAAKDQRVAAELLRAVMARAQSDAGKGRDALAWFDAGYLVESYRQATHIYKWDMLSPSNRNAWTHRNEPSGIDGYAMVKKAIQLAGSPEMHFAASLMKEGSAAAEHRRLAAEGAATGSPLARNLALK
jgi:hypothetical protein